VTETNDLRRLLAGGTLRNELTLELLGIATMERVTREYLLRHGYRQPPARCGNGHDITSDEAIFAYADHTGSRWRCRICVTEKNNRESKRRKAQPQNGGDRPCLHCGKPFTGNPNRRTCSMDCRKAILRAKCGKQPVRDEAFLLVQSMALLDLMEQRERCATHWERADVDARIAQVRARNTQ
jgi:hypothetical protein